MKSSWYKFSAWLLIIIGIISTIFYMWEAVEFGGGPEPFLPSLFFILFRIVGGIFFFLLFLIPGILYLKIKESNKLTKWSVWLTLIGMVWIILVFLYGVLYGVFSCQGAPSPGLDECLAPGIVLGMGLGLIPSGILYGIAIILLIINWFRNR